MFHTAQFTKRTLAVALCFFATSVVGCVRQKPKTGTLKGKVVLTETKKERPERCRESGPVATPLVSKVTTSPNVTVSVPDNNSEARRHFIRQVIDNQKNLNLNFTQYKNGVSLVVLTQNNSNEMCVILGKENAGPYIRKLNFIGGKIDRTPGTPEEKLVGTLYDEVREELGIHLNFSAFKESVIFICPPENKEYKSMMCFCYLSGIDTEQWQAMYKERKRRSLNWKYIEMSEIVYVPVSNIKKQPISQYVEENIALIEKAVLETKNNKMTPVSRNAFTKIDDEVTMLE